MTGIERPSVEDRLDIMELFADIPTNFPDPSEIPPPLRAYFAPLLIGSAGGPATVPGSAPGDLASFHTLIAGA